MMMGVRRNSRFFVPMNTGTSFTPARMAIMPAPDLTSAWPGFFTRVPSGNRNRFQPSRRLCMAVLTAPMSLCPRSTGNTPMARRNPPSTGMENSCFLAMIRTLNAWGMDSTNSTGSHRLEWLAHSRYGPSPSFRFSVPRSSTGRKNSTSGRSTRHTAA